MENRFNTYANFLKETFGQKIYKICLDGGFTCPNRDGSLSDKGCSFCSAGGSGDFAESRLLSIKDQLIAGRAQTREKYHGEKYLAYLQAYTNTYAPVEKLRRIYMDILEDDSIIALSIGTRPDCLSHEVLDLLEECNKIKPIHIELGFQTCHNETARRMNRGYDSEILDEAVKKLHERKIRTTVHVILGYPGETSDMQYETIEYLNRLPIDAIKLSMLYVLKDTALGQAYQREPFHLYTLPEYTEVLLGCIERLRPDIVVERITGDGPRDLLIGPEWTLHKRYVLNYIHREMKQRDSYQGKRYTKEKNHG